MRNWIVLMALVICGTMLAGCSTVPTSDEGRANLSDDVDSAINRFQREDSGLDGFLSRAAGYVMFPAVGKGGLVVGGAYGRGQVYENGKLIGYADMRQGSVGLQAGGQEYSELLVFGTPEAMNRLKEGKFEFGANASAVALKAGASSIAKFDNGVAVFTQAKGGLMFEASLAGQKFTFEPISNP